MSKRDENENGLMALKNSGIVRKSLKLTFFAEFWHIWK